MFIHISVVNLSNVSLLLWLFFKFFNNYTLQLFNIVASSYSWWTNFFLFCPIWYSNVSVQRYEQIISISMKRRRLNSFFGLLCFNLLETSVELIGSQDLLMKWIMAYDISLNERLNPGLRKVYIQDPLTSHQTGDKRFMDENYLAEFSLSGNLTQF